MRPFAIPPRQRMQTLIDASGLRNEDIGLHPNVYEEVFASSFRDQGYRPSLRGIVKVRLAEGEVKSSVYRRYRGVGLLDSDESLVTFSTLTELFGSNGWQEAGADVVLEPAGRYLGRIMFYWYHPDDAQRASFKLSLVGIFLGLVSLVN